MQGAWLIRDVLSWYQLQAWLTSIADDNADGGTLGGAMGLLVAGNMIRWKQNKTSIGFARRAQTVNIRFHCGLATSDGRKFSSVGLPRVLPPVGVHETFSWTFTR